MIHNKKTELIVILFSQFHIQYYQRIMDRYDIIAFIQTLNQTAKILCYHK